MTVRIFGGSSLLDDAGAGGSATSQGDIWLREGLGLVLFAE